MADRPSEARALDLLERAMAQPSDARADWISRQRAPPAVRARALALLGGGADAKLAFATGGAPLKAGVGPLPERIGAYRIIGLVGQGGMGAVYRGERAAGDFEHTVAIKVIRPGALSGALIERFRRERQTLARLAHPNIARLFDGGETDAGEPYIVMEFVEGRPLADWREAEAPSRDARLDLFLAATSAVAFAHQNLVVHGDITLSNILVDTAGQPKLIDFGISSPAITSGARGPATVGEGGLHTRGFAAPERILGAPSTTLSDIYSLGQVLAWLTRGDAPDAELAAIVARATAEDPAARYSTVEALRGDMIAYRAGFPVAAMDGGRRYVFGKFVARHRLAVGGAATASVLLVAALIVTLVANHQAQAARAEAEARFQQTRQIATTMLFDVYNEVSKVQGATRARDVLARTGLTYLDALTANPDAPLDVRVEAGRGYVRLAQVTGSGQQSQLGKAADANVLLKKAETVLGRAYAEAPDDPKVRRAMADLLIEQAGVNLYNNSEIALARKQTIEVQRLLKPFAGTDPEAARIYATAIQAEGDSWGWDGEYARSLEPFRRAEAFIAGLPPALRSETGVMKAHSAILRLRAEAHHELKDDAAALPAVTEAVAINEALARREPDSPEVLRKLAISLWYRAAVLSAMDRDADAYASVDRAVAITRQMRARDPADRGATGLFAVVGEVRAMVLADLKRFAESYAMADEVVAAHRQIVSQSDNAPGPRRSMAATLKSVGGVYYNGGRYPQACATWGEARGIYRDLEKAGKLTGHDRDQALGEMQRWMTAACDPPRRGLKGPL
ncbi:MAG: serine/threonine protein kinase [Alphaproteobacteria bacterium]|nr:serine/threonine protein kinase [Alphaproteobacteria bacterium]MBU1515953.1 serine/threonine protein kinase [Alphaproteobacteria bacterium]MBU2092832.1 serine/threonine protein kinase [Alphaproteobacteria bacterium]MBU2153643.1 serine/threonine protein kinase [Alphaproteobacteria bacterium]MBU2308271.1 serine/threonine protein kinase [Alphaproteobacteria bacterium]